MENLSLIFEPAFATLFSLGLFALFFVGWQIDKIKVRELRKLGLYPEKGMATMNDVEKLARFGKPTYAMRVYREIHPSAELKDAKAAVEAIVQGGRGTGA